MIEIQLRCQENRYIIETITPPGLGLDCQLNGAMLIVTLASPLPTRQLYLRGAQVKAAQCDGHPWPFEQLSFNDTILRFGHLAPQEIVFLLA